MLLALYSVSNIGVIYIVVRMNNRLDRVFEKLNGQQMATQKILNDIYTCLNRANEYLYKMSSSNEPRVRKFPYKKRNIV